MKIQDYNNTMDQIHADHNKLMEAVFKRQNTCNTASPPTTATAQTALYPHILLRPQTVLAAALAVLLLSVNILRLPLSDQKGSFTITVYAAGNDSIQLTDEPAWIRYNSDMEFAVSGPEDNWGIINYNLRFYCEGEGISSITYRCADTVITKDNYAKYPCYFVKNLTVPAAERKNYDFFRSTTSTADGISHLVLLVGNEYTVSYDAQESQNLGIEIRVVKVKEICETASSYSAFLAEPFTIDVILNMPDGNTKIKTLKLTPMENALDGFGIQVID